VIDVFLAAVGRGAGVERVMVLHWRAAGLVAVERARPMTMPSGKVPHIHHRRRG
jgi:hypothetical protein